MSQYVGMNYIGGFLPSRADFGSYNPVDKEPIGYFPQSTDLEIDEAIVAAQKALDSWKNLNRSIYFRIFFKLFFSKIDYFNNAFSLELGKSSNESKKETLNFCDRMCLSFESSVGDSTPGIVAVVSSDLMFFENVFNLMNFLFEGNTVVYKPSELTPMTGQIIAELFQDTGFPPGVFNLLHGNSIVGAKIISDKRIRCFKNC
jgi:aldehyde dehydrogenase (NAD+)